VSGSLWGKTMLYDPYTRRVLFDTPGGIVAIGPSASEVPNLWPVEAIEEAMKDVSAETLARAAEFGREIERDELKKLMGIA